MPGKRLAPTLADYVAIAICPALIMTMVGGLVFFLLEVFYVGQYQTRLQWVFGCFVFATVLIARISMMHDGGVRAPIYGILLAIPTYIATLYLIEYQTTLLKALAWPINAFILAVIWWSTHKLTYDCTYEDENSDASGRGLLEAAGLDPDAPPDQASEPERPSTPNEPTEDEEAAADDEKKPATESNGKQDAEANNDGQTRPKKKHTPGVWIIYFSLAALPLFGLGQLLLPSAKRGYGSWLLAIYVASGMGLLLCTSFLNLRRYLRERKVAMPRTVTAAWLVMGAVLIAGLVGFGLVVPWPSPEGMPESLGLAGSKDRQASRWSPFRDSPGKGPGSRSNQGVRDPQAKTHSSQVSGEQGQKPGQVAQGTQGNRQGNQGGEGRSDQRGQSREPSGSSAKGQQNEPSGSRSQRSGTTKDDPRQRGSDNQTSQSKPHDSERSGQPDRQDDTEDSGVAGSDQQQTGREQDPSASGVSSQIQFLEAPAKWLGMIFKWITLVVGVLAGGYFLVRFLANSSGWFRDLFGWLFKRQNEVPSDEVPPAETPIPQPAPFSAYADPFLTGAASNWPPSEVVRYTFEALEAWAWERGLARQPDETPLEFAHRLGEQVPKLGVPVRRVADLFVRLCYARQVPTPAALPVVRELWQALAEVPRPEASAATTSSATLVQ